MSKKRKGTKRRRSVGAMSFNAKSPLMKIAAVAAGYLLADTLNAPILKLLPPTTTPATATTPAITTGNSMAVYVPYAELGLGALLLFKGKSSIIKTGAGGVLAGMGLKSVLKSMGVVSGYQNTPVLGRRMAGYQNTPVLGNMPPQLSGTDANGYRVNGPAFNTPNALSGYIPNGSGVGVMGALYTNGSGINNSDR